MITTYKLMRGLMKRKIARDSAFFAYKLINKKSYQQFIAAQSKKINQSIFNFDSATIRETVQQVVDDGATAGLKLPAHVVKHVYEYAKASPVFADREPQYGFYLHQLEQAKQALGKDILLAQYFNILDDEIINNLACDPYLQMIAANYLQCKPKLMGANLWWTFPSSPSTEDKNKHAHVFHYDLDDVKFIKFFFYITDVDQNAGPHVFVKESSKKIKYKNSLVKSIRFTDSDIEKWYGNENIITVTGPAGSTLIEDTITIHKGTTPKSTPRLLLQFEFGINQFPEIKCECAIENQKFIV